VPTTDTPSDISHIGPPFLVLQQGRDGANGRDGRDGPPGPAGLWGKGRTRNTIYCYSFVSIYITIQYRPGYSKEYTK